MIRKLQPKDATLMFETMCDSNVNHYMNIGTATTLEKCKAFIAEAQTDERNFHFAIVDENDNWIGTISLKNIDKNVKQAEYAIITTSRCHGTGIASIATNELLEYAFNELCLNRVYLNVVKDNVRANKFYQKVGFKYEGSFRESIIIKGQLYDLNWYSLLKKEWHK